MPKITDNAADTATAADAPAADAVLQPETATDSATAPVVEATPAPDPVAQAIDQWVTDQLSNSPLSRNTECWSVLRTALPALATMIKEIKQ